VLPPQLRRALVLCPALLLCLLPGIEAVAAARSPAPNARADPARTVHLPIVAVTHRESCAPPSPFVPKCPGLDQTDWAVLCGGFGRVSDLFASEDGGVLAIGDGVAKFASFDSARTVPEWAPQLGMALVGLNDMSIESGETRACPQPPCGWAVGDRDVIVRYGHGCWVEPDGGTNDRVVLRSVHVTDRGDGWAVGEESEGTRNHAALRALRQDAAGPRWFDETSDATQLPPLTDVQVFISQKQHTEAWAVGGELPSGGQFIQWSADDSRWQSIVRATGYPRELAMTDNGSTGWAFGQGPGAPSAELALVGWRYDPSSGWQPAGFERPGRELVDVYLQVPERGDPVIWVGVSPGPDPDPLLYRYVRGASDPEPLGTPPEALDSGGPDGNRAIVPLSDGRVVYAWGDEVWTVDTAADAWTRVRRRHRLMDLAPTLAGHWLLAETAAGSRLLTLDSSGLNPVAGSGSGTSALPRLNALDAAAGEVWAVGDNAVSLRARGPLGRWRWVTRADSSAGRFQAVDVNAAGEVWAAGEGADGFGRVWQFDGQAWRERARTRDPTALNGIVRAPGGHMWAVGNGVVLSMAPGCVPPQPNGCTAEWILPGANLIAATAIDAGTAWAAGENFIVPLARQSFAAPEPLRRADGSNALPFGARLVALIAVAPDDVWAAFVCCHPGYEPGREYSAVIHFNGTAWREHMVINVPVSALRASSQGTRRTLWVIGDWSTVVRHTYNTP